MQDLGALLKRAIELLMPQVKHYYKVVKKGKITKSYCQDGGYYADVQPLRNDDSEDESEPLLSKVELPVIWGGANRGIVCLPAKDTLCDIEYYNGDPNFPRISNIRWKGNKAPQADADEFLIQQEDGGTFVIIKSDGTVVIKSDNIQLGEENPSEYVALATKVKNELTSIQNAFTQLKTEFGAHIHPSAMGPTSAPTVPLTVNYQAQDVAASNVKAK